MSILLVEDNPVTLKLMDINLLKHGYSTFLAKDGREALSVLENHAEEIELILTDIMMPEMSGFEMCSEIKKNEGWSQIPIIMCSVLSDVKHVQQAVQFGCTGYLVKPINFEKLRNKIETVLGKGVGKEDGGDDKSEEVALSFSKLIKEKIDLLENAVLGDGAENSEGSFNDLLEAATCFGVKWVKNLLNRIQEVEDDLRNNKDCSSDKYMGLLKELKKVYSLLPNHDPDMYYGEEFLKDLRDAVEDQNAELVENFENVAKGFDRNKVVVSNVRTIKSNALAVENIFAADGILLVSKGQLISEKIVEKLHNYMSRIGVIEPFKVIYLKTDEKESGAAGPKATQVPKKKSPGPPIDFELCLKSMSGNRTQMNNRIGSFLSELPDNLSLFKELYAENDIKAFKKLAKTIKKESDAIHAPNVHAIVSQLEYIENDQWNKLTPLLLDNLEKEAVHIVEFVFGSDWFTKT